MKMRYLFLFLFAALGFSACEEAGERFYLYQIDDVYFQDEAISGTVLEITGGSNVGIMGGVAPYTVEIADKQIVKAGVFPFGRDKDEYEIRISSLQLGSTSIVVKDASGLAIRLKVKVVEGINIFLTKAVKVEIEGTTVSDEDKDNIKKEVEKAADMKPGDGIKFVFQTKENGTLVLNSARGASLAGTFTKETKEVEGKSAISIHAIYDNGAMHIFNMTDKIENTLIEKSRALGPTHLNLEEDVTEKIQDKYPNATSVILVYEGTMSR